jgi:hypothetical protein
LRKGIVVASTSQNRWYLLGLLPDLLLLLGAFLFVAIAPAYGQSRYATSDNLSGYVHWIEMYDANNNRIDPNAENPPPYSPANTCGRCHDFNTIAHGWHFNSVDETLHGRPGQPWVWSDPRTGTHLPLSYRDWAGTYDPDALGISRWQMAAKFGGFLPGGGPGSSEALKELVKSLKGSEIIDRSHITGSLPVDCMLCHHRPGSGYSPFVWTEQIEDQNFAFAPAAALGIATVSGTMKRLKDNFDPAAEESAKQLPQLTYLSERFRPDGKVFFDLVRKPDNSACYYCHSNISNDSVTGNRWLHDEDVHLRAGFQCADCHRNALDHHTVRGYDGEQSPVDASIASLSCQGCHVGDHAGQPLDFTGRLGAPRPQHKGLPPLHFEKMTCTACHSGPAVAASVGHQLNSIIHRLGTHVKRTGEEYPGIVAPVIMPAPKAKATSGKADNEIAAGEPADSEHGTESRDSPYTPHRLMWPAYWGTIQDGNVQVLNPDQVYELVRRDLKVRRDFTEELAEVKLSLSERAKLIGEDRARLKPDDWTDEEKKKLGEAEAIQRTAQIAERMSVGLAAIEAAIPGTQAVYISGGQGFVREGDKGLKELDAAELGKAAEPYAWPLAHNVRPAQQSLGATGCTECHSDQSLFFNADITPVGLLPNQPTQPVKSHVVQAADMERLGRWNQMFAGRSTFKIFGLLALAVAGLITFVGAAALRSSPVAMASAAATTTDGKVHLRRAWFHSLIYVAFMGVLALLSVTSFGSLLQSKPLSGYVLMAHVAGAGAFTFLLVAIAWLYLPTYSHAEQGFRFEHRWWLARWSAWLLVVGSLAAAGTMFLSMLPVLNTESLKQVALLHRYAGIVTVVAAVLNVFAMAWTRFKW